MNHSNLMLQEAMSFSFYRRFNDIWDYEWTVKWESEAFVPTRDGQGEIFWLKLDSLLRSDYLII